MNNFFEKITDIFFNFTKKMDDYSEKIFEETGKKIDIKMIVLAVVLLIFTIIVVKAVLGWLWTLLYA